MFNQIIFVFILVSAYIPAIAVAQDDGKLTDGNICDKPKCKTIADMLVKQMGEKKPCEDFHNYVCGEWKGDLELNETKLKKTAVRTLSNLLDKAAAPLGEKFTATEKLIQAYESCTKNGRSNASLKISVERVIQQYNFTQWPIIEPGPKPSPFTSDDYIKVLKKTGPRPVFPYSISNESSGTIIEMTKPWEFDVFENNKFPVPDSRSDAISGMEGESDTPSYNYDLYDEISKNEEEAYKTFIRKTIHLINESVSNQDAIDVAEGIVKIEKGLATLAMGEIGKGERRLSISELDHLVGEGFSMAPILRRDFEGLGISIDDNTEVVVLYIDYYQKAVNFMKCTTMAELANYVLWTKIRKMAEATGTVLNDIYVEYKNKTHYPDIPLLEESSEEKTTSLKLTCVRQLLDTGVMYTAGAHYYVMNKFNEKAKKYVLKMMEFVNSSFMHVVNESSWMSIPKREEAIKRLQTMDAVIGYPNWLLNETIINTVYHFVPDIEKNASFAEHFHFLLENEHKRTLLKLQQGMYFDKAKETVTLRSHAYYVDASNSLVYPAAALVTHYRGNRIPRSFYFGTIGTVLAQLFATSIERYSHLPGKTGKYYQDKWDDQTRDDFCKRSSCLNNTEECNDTSLSGNDKHEKLRDYLGLRISFQAMQQSKQNYTPPFLLSDKEMFNNESKIFFILFGSLYCPISVNVNGKRVQSRSADEEKYHDTLNEIVYIYNEFNNTFGCGLSPGADTCQLMPPDEPNPPPNC